MKCSGSLSAVPATVKPLTHDILNDGNGVTCGELFDAVLVSVGPIWADAPKGEDKNGNTPCETCTDLGVVLRACVQLVPAEFNKAVCPPPEVHVFV